jgi:transposase
MDATAIAPDAPLPTDVASLQAMVRELLAEVARLRAENAELKAKLDAATRHRFGRRSERKKPAPVPTDPKPARRRDEHGRRALPEHLERRDVVHDLTDEQKLCPACGRVREFIGEQGAEQLDLDPPRFFVLRTRKRSYACRHCDPTAVPSEQRIATAGPTQVGPIAKGLCGPGLLAHTITAKFADHVPVHRLAGQLSRSGVAIARSTLGDWLAQAAGLLDPLVKLMHQRLLGSRVVHADDTPVKLRVAKQDRTTKAHLWVAIGDADYPYVVFDFTRDYTAQGPHAFFKGYAGYLQADALAQYEQLYGPEKIQHVCCWAHARRKFVAAHEAGDGRASRALELIGKLYAVERTLPPLPAPSDDPVAAEQRRIREEHRREIRVRESEGVLSELQSWLESTRPGALPKSPLGSAIGYTTNNWAALMRYREEGYLVIDNVIAPYYTSYVG